MKFHQKVYILGRGDVIYGTLQPGEPYPEKGMSVEYQGEMYEVVGIERWRRGPHAVVTPHVGLIVKKVEEG